MTTLTLMPVATLSHCSKSAETSTRYFQPATHPTVPVKRPVASKAALRKLGEAVQQRSELVVFPDAAGGLRNDPKLDELRGEPEFQTLLEDVWPK